MDCAGDCIASEAKGLRNKREDGDENEGGHAGAHVDGDAGCDAGDGVCPSKWTSCSGKCVEDTYVWGGL